jgi:hypothetical protein
MYFLWIVALRHHVSTIPFVILLTQKKDETKLRRQFLKLVVEAMERKVIQHNECGQDRILWKTKLTTSIGDSIDDEDVLDRIKMCVNISQTKRRKEGELWSKSVFHLICREWLQDPQEFIESLI